MTLCIMVRKEKIMLKKITAAFLGCAMILGMTACTQTDAPPAATTIDDDIFNPVDVSGIDLDNKPKDVDIKGKKIKYLGCYDITKAGDIKPAVKYLEQNYEASIECEIVGDGEIMETLATYISNGMSPDLVDRRSNSFPYYALLNSYEPLDDYIDLNKPQWADVKSVIDGYAIDGKHYYYPWSYYMCDRVLVYNEGKFKEFGIKDPKELWDNNEWTWDAFRDCMTQFVTKAQNDVPDAIGVYGSFGNTFINTTGVPLVGFEDGKLVSHLEDSNIDRAQTFLFNLKKEGLSRLTYGDYGTVSNEPVINGSAAFMSMGDWILPGFAEDEEKNGGDHNFVPMPRDPQSDKYNYTLGTFGYLVPSGASNTQAAAVFIDCVRSSKLDKEMQAVIAESIKKSKHYTDEWYDWLDYFQNMENFKPDQLVSDFAYSLDTDTTNNVISKICEDIPFVENDEITSWTAMRESFKAMLDDSISKINQGQ